MNNVIYKTEDIEIVIDEDEDLIDDIREQVEETVDDMLTHLSFDDLSTFDNKGRFSITIPIVISTCATESMEDFLADVKKIVTTPITKYSAGGRYYGSVYPYGSFWMKDVQTTPKQAARKAKNEEKIRTLLL